MRLLRRMHPPGTSPGTIMEVPADEAPARAVLARYSTSDLHEEEIDGLDILGEAPPGQLTWIDVEGRDAALIASLGRRLRIHPLALEDVVNGGQRPKVEDYEGSVFVVMHHLERRSSDAPISAEQMSFVLQEGVLVSFRETPSSVFEPVRKRLRHGKGKIRAAGLDYLAYALADAVVDHFFPLLDDLGLRIEGVEESITEDPSPADMVDLHELRRDLVLIRRSVWPLREMLLRLIMTESALIREDTRVFLRDVADHLSVIADLVETYREMVSSLMDLHISTVSNHTNEVMKVLTIIATIFIPLSFVAGLYGMNFSPEASPWNMPELGWYWGYPAALAVMAAVAGALLLHFWRKGWL